MYRKGIFLATITACISGISIFSNSLFVSKTDPLIFAITRNAMVAFLLTGVLIFTKKYTELLHLSKKQWLQLIIIGAIGGGIPFALFFTGLSQIGAVNGNILNKTIFIWVALLAVPMLHEKITLAQIAGYAAVFLGMFVIGGTFTLIPSAGSWLVLLATMLWALEYVLSKITLNDMSPELLGWGRIVFGLPFLFGASVIVGKTYLLASTATYVFLPLIISSVLLVFYILSWYGALKRAPATLVSSILVLAPFVTAILAFGIQGKSMATAQLASFALLILGVFLITVSSVAMKRIQSGAGSAVR